MYVASYTGMYFIVPEDMRSMELTSKQSMWKWSLSMRCHEGDTVC